MLRNVAISHGLVRPRRQIRQVTKVVVRVEGVMGCEGCEARQAVNGRVLSTYDYPSLVCVEG